MGEIMSLDSTREDAMVLGLTAYNPVTQELKTAAGARIPGVAVYDWTTFLTKDPADFNHIFVLISDKHMPHHTRGGTLVVGDATATARWAFHSAPTFTVATMPAASLFPGCIFFVSDIGVRGSYWYSNGTRWNLHQTEVVLKSINADLVVSGQPTTAAVGAQTTLPLIDGNSIWGNGDILDIQQVWEKTGAVDLFTGSIFIGTSALALSALESSGSNTSIHTAVSAAVGNTTQSMDVRLRRISATSVKLQGVSAIGSKAASGTKPTPVTITSLDSAQSYVDASVKFGAAPTDTALTLSGYTVKLISCGAA